MIIVRPETSADAPRVFAVNCAAFPTSAEARLVEALRKHAQPFISWVADLDRQIIGHILFTPVSVMGSERAVGLAPFAVRPEWQRRGIGTRLVQAGLDACRGLGAAAVFVLGHPEYYARFGFRPAADHGLRYAGPESEPHLSVLELQNRALEELRGEVKYHPVFGSLEEVNH